MKQEALIAFVTGSLFGTGLCVSGMVRPEKVMGFLDVTGAWDPTMAFVMIGALGVMFTAYGVQRRMARPVSCEMFYIPEKKSIDAPLIAGAILFGIGWGLVGICPGPAITALGFGLPKIGLFVVAMVLGMVLHKFVFSGSGKK